MGLEEIFDKYYDRVYSFTLLRVKNIHTAEDITSDVFYKVAQSINSYDEKKAAMATWLITIAMNKIRDYYRGQKHLMPLESAEDIQAQVNLEEKVLANEQAKELYKAMDKLDERQRNVLLLRYYGDMSNKEIAKELNLSVSNVETILTRARQKLKKILV